MQTKLSRICDAVIEAGWLAALVVTPLFFNASSNRVFEPDKIHLLRSIALLMSVAWLTQLLDVGLRGRTSSGGDLRRAIRGTPLVLPALILVAAYLLSTVLSVVPRISFFGSYVRMQGTFSFLSYVAIFAMVLTHLRSRSQVNRLIHAVVLTSVPVSIYGIIQHFGLDPLPWGGDVQERVAANMGNAIFISAYLIMAVFLTLERLIDSVASLLSVEHGRSEDALRAGAYLFVLLIQIMAIVFSQSRGPWLGLGTGLYLFGLLGVLLLGRWAVRQPRAPRWVRGVVLPAWLSLIGVSVAGVAFLVTLNIPQGPLQSLRDKPYIARLATLMNTQEGTNAVRALIWEGVVDMMLVPHEPIQKPDGTPDSLNVIRPLVGYGPESMWVAYNRFYPPDLAHYESRNASPDRSHNETFDTLVRTGLIGFAVQLWLFGSVFYYSLRWLGLIQGSGHRYLFLALLAGGAIIGVVTPVIFDHSLRLAGIGLPTGLLVGVVIYVTVDLLISNNRPTEPAAAPADAPRTSGRRQVLILAVFAAIVAHFMEVHLGIAIAATRTHFWVLAAVLVVAGMGWLDRAEVAVPVAADGPRAQARVQTAGQSRKHRRHRSDDDAAGKSRMPAGNVIAGPLVTPMRQLLPYLAIAALLTVILTWDYLVNQTGAKGAWALLWDAFTARVSATGYQIVKSPMLLVLVGFTWLIGGMLAISECPAPAGTRFPMVRGIACYLLATVGVWLIYGLLQASRISYEGLAGMQVFRRMAGNIVAFDLVALAVIVGLSVALWFADTRPRPTRAFRATAAVPLLGGAALGVVALLIIINVNIQTVQADTYYKQGLSYEGAGSWESAVILYREAAGLEPQEDYYYLFLGRALLQLASNQEAGGDAILPADYDATPTSQLLAMVDRGLRSRTQEDLLRSSYAALTAAQRLNPLNTDHSANLARLNRTWAFSGAVGAGESPTNSTLRQLVKSKPDQVDVSRLDLALTHYGQATSLSPGNAHLWNELATVQFILGDSDLALQTLDHSLTLDQRFDETWLFRGDFLVADEDREGALDAYRRAAELRPSDVGVQSAVGVYSAQLGDVEGSLAAFERVITIGQGRLVASENALESLDAIAARAGGYSSLLPAAGTRRNQILAEITSQQSQLHLVYRNKALVLTEAGRHTEALEVAQTALSLADESQKATIERLIADIQARIGS